VSLAVTKWEVTAKRTFKTIKF